MRRISFPDADQMRDRLRTQGFCTYKGKDLLLAGDFDHDKRVLESVFDDARDDGPARRRYYGRYLLCPGWTCEMLDLDVRSHAFLSSDYRQTTDMNPEQYGALRSYAHLPEAIWRNGLLKELIFFDMNLMPLGEFWPNALRNPLAVGVHLIRMCAVPGHPSVASPTVPHQDGEPFTCIHLINRRGVQGGFSQVFRNSPVDNVNRPGELLSEFILDELLDTLVVWDKEVFHHVTPVEAHSGYAQATRDVLIIDFTPFEECKFNARGEIGIAPGSFRASLREAGKESVRDQGEVINA